MDKKSSVDQLSVSFAANANLSEVEKVRINLIKIKTQQGHAKAQRYQFATERLRLMQRKTRITNTHQHRHDRTVQQLDNMRRPATQLIPGEMRGANGRAIPLTDRDRQDINWHADSRIKGQNQQIADRIDNRAFQLLNKKLEKIISQEHKNSKILDETKEQRHNREYCENKRDVTRRAGRSERQGRRAGRTGHGQSKGRGI